MKRAIPVFFVVLLMVTSISFAASPINFPRGRATFNQDDDLVLLGKVWGLIKYHHPAVTKGTYNWDQELIKILPNYRACKNKTDRNQLLLKWINGLGAIGAVHAIPDSLLAGAKLKPDYSWIGKSSLSPELVDLLTQISQSSITGDQQYVKFMADDDIVIPSFINEDGYTQMTYPTDDYRLLAVYRYWNIIEYWYPYKYLARQKWSDCLKPFIAEALNAGDASAYTRFIQKMVGTIQDSHATVSAKKTNELNGLWFMPFTVKFIEDKAVINAINRKLLPDTSIKVGNIVQTINGITINKIVADKTPYVSASNHSVVLREVARLINRSTDSVSYLTILNNDGVAQEHAIKNSRTASYSILNTYDFAYQKDSSCFVLPGNVLYVNAGTFKTTQVAFVKQQLKTVKGLVLDARQYPTLGAGSLVALLQQLLLADKAAMSKFSSLVKGYPGLFRYANPFIIGEANADYYKGKVAIIVNEETQSTGEFLTMAYMLAPKAIVVGSTTAGADGNVTYPFSFPGGIATQITGLGVYFPDGKETQQVGIVANIKAKQTIAGFREHKDDLLDKAVEVINAEK